MFDNILSLNPVGINLFHTLSATAYFCIYPGGLVFYYVRNRQRYTWNVDTCMPAYTRHNEVLIFDSMPGHVEAHYFNVAQTALKRVDDQWRFKIPTLNHLDLILQEDAWIVVDRVLNDMPVAAWTNFQTEGRDNLHEPVACDIRIYHFAARMVFQTTLDAMENHLRQFLTEQKSKKAENVLMFNYDE